MKETAEEIEALQALLDRSHGAAGSHMGSIVTPDRRLTANQVVNYLQGVKHVAFGTVTAKGEPFVSPLDSLFLHGHFFVGTAGSAVKARHVAKRPAVSLCHVMGDDIGIWVHGRVEQILRQRDPGVAPYAAVWEEVYGESPFGLDDDVVFMPVVPRVMFAYAFHPEKFPA